MATATSTPARCTAPSRGLPTARGLPLDDEPAIAQLARSVALDVENGRVLIDGHDVTTVIRTAAMDRASASVARLPSVRHVLVERQRALGAHGGIVMEGRDIGTVVFPDADLKVYLDADPAERARRRAMDPAHQVERRAGGRCRRRHGRPRPTRHAPALTSPLAVAADAVHIDTTGSRSGRRGRRRSWGWSGRSRRLEMSTNELTNDDWPDAADPTPEARGVIRQSSLCISSSAYHRRFRRFSSLARPS